MRGAAPPTAAPGGTGAGERGASAAELELLWKLVAIPSPSGGEARAVAWLAEWLRGVGVAAEIDGAGNLIAALDPAPGAEPLPPVYLLGHIDTVPGFWPPRLRGGRLSARGASDAKGPLAAFACAALRSRDCGGMRRPVRLLAAVDEEGSSEGARHLARTLPPPAYLIVGEPSGWDRVVLGYQGSLRCRLEVGRPAGHSSRPDPTAAEMVVELWPRVRDLVRELNHGALGFEALHAHLLGIECESDGLRDRARLRLGFRVPPGLGERELTARLAALTGEAALAVESWVGPAIAPRTGPLPAAFSRAIAATGIRATWQRRLATSDLNVVLPEWRCPALVYGPGDSALDHSPEESVSVADYSRAIAVLARALSEL